MTNVSNVNLSKFSIGVVDDDPIDITALRAILSGNGFTNLTVFNTVDSARRHIMTGNVFDLLFVDLNVSAKNDGLQLCSDLNNTLKEAIPVIVLTSTTTIADHVSSLRAGALNVIIKPYTEDILINNVKAALKINYFPGRQKVKVKRLQQLQLRFPGVKLA